jgi:AcrR family transcriptional regulator
VAHSELSAETRARILEAAFQRVREGGTSAVSVKDIARSAGVSRQLVYFHYGNRAGLLVAMARHRDAEAGFVERVRASRELPPAPALERLLRDWCDYLPDVLPVARALEAALITGDDGGTAWRDRMTDLREAFLRAVVRVERDGLLAPGWSAGRAADWLWSHVQPSTYAHLVGERGWEHDDYAERTISSLLDTILIHGPSAPADARETSPGRDRRRRPRSSARATGSHDAGER